MYPERSVLLLIIKKIKKQNLKNEIQIARLGESILRNDLI